MEKIRKWFENYWYYYKHRTLIGLFFAVFFAIAISQMVQKDKIDAYLMYAGPVSLGGTQTEQMESSLEQVMKGDYHADGKKNAQVLTLYLMNNKQIEEAKAEAKAQGIQDFYVDMDYMTSARQQFDLQFLAGDCYLCLLDPSLYEEMKTMGAFDKIDDPRSKDGFGVPFFETDFASFFAEAYRYMPQDVILCVRKVPATSLGKQKEAEKQAFHADLLRQILAFSTSE